MTAINTNVGALNARLYTLGANRAQEQAMENLYFPLMSQAHQ